MRKPDEIYSKLLAKYPDDFYPFAQSITTPMIKEVFFQCYSASDRPSSAVIPLDVDFDFFRLRIYLSDKKPALSGTEKGELLEFIYKTGLMVLDKFLVDNGHPTNGRHFELFVNIPEEGAVVFAPDEFIKTAADLFRKGGVDSLMDYVYGK